jgi:protein ImuB
MARFGGRRAVVVQEGGAAKALEPLPIEALRLSGDTRTALRRLGIKRIGDLIDKPRAPLAVRFDAGLLHRLDQALGRVPEPIDPVVPQPCYGAARRLLEPVFGQGTILAIAVDLMAELAGALEKGGAGAQLLRVSLYRVDGEVFAFPLGFSVPTRDVAHVERLLRLKLDGLEGRIDPGFGIEAIRLDVLSAVAVAPRQTTFGSAKEASPRDRLAGLVDVVRNRVGPRAVRQLWPVESHNPERAVAAHAVGRGSPAWGGSGGPRPRPVFLLPRAEPAEDVMAAVPDGPPPALPLAQRVARVAHPRGRSASPPSGGGAQSGPARDYYVVEDRPAIRFWLFREAFTGARAKDPAGSCHGLLRIGRAMSA